MSVCATTAWRSCSPVGRSSTGRTHSKLRGLVRKDLFDFQTSSEDLKGYDACFFCLGVSSVGMSGADYTRLTYDRTLGSAQVLARTNPGMTFVYVSGTGTGGKAMWAQVKGRTERALVALPERIHVPLGHITAYTRRGLKDALDADRLRPLSPASTADTGGWAASVISTEELGRAMIRAARQGAPKRVLESRDMIALGATEPGAVSG